VRASQVPPNPKGVMVGRDLCAEFPAPSREINVKDWIDIG